MLVLLTVSLCLCAGYGQAFNILCLYDGTYDAAHINFVHEAIKFIPAAAQEHGYTVKCTNDWGQLNTNNLKNYQVVLFLDTVPWDDTPRKALQEYVENGGGLMAFHASAYVDNPNEWPWFHQTLLGTGMFKSNTWWPTKVHYKVDAPNHPAMKGLPAKFESAVSEWYDWQHDLRQNPDIEVLASIDPSSFPVGTDPNQSWYDGYRPLIWSNKKHKVIYCNFGHNYMVEKSNTSYTFASNDQNTFLFQALQYLAGQ